MGMYPTRRSRAIPHPFVGPEPLPAPSASESRLRPAPRLIHFIPIAVLIPITYHFPSCLGPHPYFDLRMKWQKAVGIAGYPKMFTSRAVIHPSLQTPRLQSAESCAGSAAVHCGSTASTLIHCSASGTSPSKRTLLVRSQTLPCALTEDRGRK